MESVLRLHPKARIILNIREAGSGKSEEEEEEEDGGHVQAVLEEEFAVFTQAGYKIEY